MGDITSKLIDPKLSINNQILAILQLYCVRIVWISVPLLVSCFKTQLQFANCSRCSVLWRFCISVIPGINRVLYISEDY